MKTKEIDGETYNIVPEPDKGQCAGCAFDKQRNCPGLTLNEDVYPCADEGVIFAQATP